ncbi:MAG: response regulator transcription factor [Crocinitomicaceae bacterium]|nr:response regulator transcription factor [Crocinitomicaceae bacterium]
MKVLVIEDEAALRNSIESFLREKEFLCEVASSFDEADYKIGLYPYDIILVDITLPDGNGLDLIQKIKIEDKDAGILIISAKNSVDDRIKGLDLGADDYITKPFHLSEVNSRINAILRRKKFEGSSLLQFDDIVIDLDAKTAMVQSEILELTKKEFDLLIHLVVNKERVLTKESIAEHLWEDQVDLLDNFDFVYTHIKNLRKKILRINGKDYLKTIYGMGYKFTSV